MCNEISLQYSCKRGIGYLEKKYAEKKKEKR
jgi:hypothetical protein